MISTNNIHPYTLYLSDLRAVNQLRRNSAHTGLLVRNDADTIRNILYVNNLLNNLVWFICHNRGASYPIPLSGGWTFSQKVTVSLFSIRSNFHRMLKQSAFCRKKPNKSKVFAISAEKWMCVSVSAEWWYKLRFTPGDKLWRTGNIHFGERILFRKSYFTSWGWEDE